MRQPEKALAQIKRFNKRYVATKASILLTALAMAQQKLYSKAWTLLSEERLVTNHAAMAWFVGEDAMRDWLFGWLNEIRAEVSKVGRAVRSSERAVKPVRAPAPKLRPAAVPVPAQPVVADLPKLKARFDIDLELGNAEDIAFDGPVSDPMAFHLRSEMVRLSLFEGFDELLCLPALQGVEAHWYQVETVRKVLKQYRGRVLLADEVGLGKTVEAGMVLKEYMLRGMAERILILDPGLAGRAVAR